MGEAPWNIMTGLSLGFMLKMDKMVFPLSPVAGDMML